MAAWVTNHLCTLIAELHTYNTDKHLQKAIYPCFKSSKDSLRGLKVFMFRVFERIINWKRNDNLKKHKYRKLNSYIKHLNSSIIMLLKS